MSLNDCHPPVVQRSSRVLAALDFDHQQREEEEEHGHAEANAVHSLVAHQHITVDVTLHPRKRGGHPSFTEARDLQGHKKNQGCCRFDLLVKVSQEVARRPVVYESGCHSGDFDDSR